MFNWLQPYLYQSHCLDCFAGSGVLGFEALSRGADSVVFVENNIKTVANLRKNCNQLNTNAAVIHYEDTLSWLLAAQPQQYFNLLFLDPPFHSNLLEKSSALLSSSGILAEDAIIYVEHAIDADVVLPDNWVSLKQKTAGQVSYKLFVYRA